jgi:ABC-type nitrate/sulfonate/bicarbonate transport system substrate-binding protein
LTIDAALCSQIGNAGRECTRPITQVTAIALYWPDFIAQQKGFYAAEGLDAESFFAGSTAAATQNLISGTIDIASAAT